MDERLEADFDLLVRTCGTRLVRTAYLLTGDWGHAEDLVQTALAKTYARWSRLRDPGAGEAYVRRVMTSTYAKWWRRHWRGEIPTEELPEPAGSDPYVDADVRDALARALARLPAHQRAVVVLRYFDDLSETEVADALGCSPGTVKSRTSRALAALRGLGLLDGESGLRRSWNGPREETG